MVRLRYQLSFRMLVRPFNEHRFTPELVAPHDLDSNL
jgi:hypothetical protein